MMTRFDDGRTEQARILLSPPDVEARERELLMQSFDSGWIAPVGPQLDAFEEGLRKQSGVGDAVGLSSGTAGLHLALQLVGVAPGDEVVCSDLTFAASVSAVTYLDARPVLIDADLRHGS
jgi:pyridoxal phosphate-dependent aminotransferase EpsN